MTDNSTDYQPRISIITPSLNQGEFIEAAILSVLGQDYPEIEYLIIDGGSTDNSVEIIKKYSDRLAYWVSTPDGGQPQAINQGLRRATGEIVAYLNSDDHYLPGAFRAVAEALAPRPEEEESSDWIAGEAIYKFQKSGEEKLWMPTLPMVPWRNVTLPWAVPQVSCFWRRKLFHRFGFFREDLQYCFDTEFEVRLALGGSLPRIVRQPLAVRFLQEESKSMTVPQRFREEQQRFLSIFADELPEPEYRQAFFMWSWKDACYQVHDRRLLSAFLSFCTLIIQYPLSFGRMVSGRLKARLGWRKEL
ncbi:MAG: glycosyltransferase [Planctomycetes bacterium]|nr:glycosyltransferase [Planctomycetota bacterium]